MKRTIKFTTFTFVVSLFAVSMFAASPLVVNNNTVSASVAASCTLVTPFDLAFGPYDPFGGAVTKTGTLSLSCTKKAAVTVDLDKGLHSSATMRGMLGTDNADTLPYQIYTDGTFGTVWGTGFASGATKGAVGQGTSKNTDITVNGRIPAGQDVSVDTSYNDTVVATVNF